MFALCRRSTRMIHNSTTNQAAVISPSALKEQELEEISLQPIFDIFDAPSRLSESSDFIRSKYKSTTKAAAIVTPLPSHVSSPPRPLSRPASLPSPIIFEGPARPKNEALAVQRRLRDAGLSPQPRRHRVPASSRPFSSSEPLVQLFDGPARITRYHHQSQSEREVCAPYFDDQLSGIEVSITAFPFFKIDCLARPHRCHWMRHPLEGHRRLITV